MMKQEVFGGRSGVKDEEKKASVDGDDTDDTVIGGIPVDRDPDDVENDDAFQDRIETKRVLPPRPNLLLDDRKRAPPAPQHHPAAAVSPHRPIQAARAVPVVPVKVAPPRQPQSSSNSINTSNGRPLSRMDVEASIPIRGGESGRSGWSDASMESSHIDDDLASMDLEALNPPPLEKDATIQQSMSPQRPPPPLPATSSSSVASVPSSLPSTAKKVTTGSKLAKRSYVRVAMDNDSVDLTELTPPTKHDPSIMTSNAAFVVPQLPASRDRSSQSQSSQSQISSVSSFSPSSSSSGGSSNASSQLSLPSLSPLIIASPASAPSSIRASPSSSSIMSMGTAASPIALLSPSESKHAVAGVTDLSADDDVIDVTNDEPHVNAKHARPTSSSSSPSSSKSSSNAAATQQTSMFDYMNKQTPKRQPTTSMTGKPSPLKMDVIETMPSSPPSLSPVSSSITTATVTTTTMTSMTSSITTMDKTVISSSSSSSSSSRNVSSIRGGVLLSPYQYLRSLSFETDHTRQVVIKVSLSR
jgi:hypothetical protein